MSQEPDDMEMIKAVTPMIIWAVLLGGAIVYSSRWLADFSQKEVLV